MSGNNGAGAKTGGIEKIMRVVSDMLANFPVNIVDDVHKPNEERKILLINLEEKHKYDLCIAWDHRRHYYPNFSKYEICMRLLKMENERKDFSAYIADKGEKSHGN